MRRWTIAVAAVFVVATAVFAQRQGESQPIQRGPAVAEPLGRGLITTEPTNLGQRRKGPGDFIQAGDYRINRARIDFARSYKEPGSDRASTLLVFVGGRADPITLTGAAIEEFAAVLGLGQSVEQLEPASPFDADARPSTRRGSLPPPPLPK